MILVPQDWGIRAQILPMSNTSLSYRLCNAFFVPRSSEAINFGRIELIDFGSSSKPFCVEDTVFFLNRYFPRGRTRYKYYGRY